MRGATIYAALLRAVNVGGTGLLPIAERAGFATVRTYIASGNVVFRSELDEARIKRELEAGLADFAGKPVDVLVRTSDELAAIVAANPFPDTPGNQVMVTFLDEVVSPATLAGITGQGADEEVALGRRELYVRYGAGIGRSKLRIPAAVGTARNMNTSAKLAATARET